MLDIKKEKSYISVAQPGSPISSMSVPIPAAVVQNREGHRREAREIELLSVVMIISVVAEILLIRSIRSFRGSERERRKTKKILQAGSYVSGYPALVGGRLCPPAIDVPAWLSTSTRGMKSPSSSPFGRFES